MTVKQLQILKLFSIENIRAITPFGNGLINATYKVIAEDEFIFQKINSKVFKNPLAIFNNEIVLQNYLIENNIDYQMVQTYKTQWGKNYYKDEEDNYYRVSAFIKKSHTIDVVQNADQAYEAAKAFGKFTCAFKNLNTSTLEPVLSDFHNIFLRYNQFLITIKNGNSSRIKQCETQIKKLLSYADIVNKYKAILTDKNWKKRLTHHDTKISNVLFNAENKATHVIDLDTVMPGYFISDVGDMMRTYLSPVSEEEADTEKIVIRKDMYQAICNGYANTMQDTLTAVEKENFAYAGSFMIYMQALRFCTDYLNNDIYYGAKYEQHNYVRAYNQINLLEKFMVFERSI